MMYAVPVTRWIAVGLCLLAGCDAETRRAEARLAKRAVELVAESMAAIGASSKGAYSEPSSPCDVVDLRPFSHLGRPSSGATETEGDGQQITGCVFDLTAKDSVNRFMLFVSVDSDPDTRFATFQRSWGGTTSGFATEWVDGVGDQALYASRLTEDNLRIDTVLAVLDRNLYLEARFSGNSAQAWDTADMRERLVDSSVSSMRSLGR